MKHTLLTTQVHAHHTALSSCIHPNPSPVSAKTQQPHAQQHTVTTCAHLPSCKRRPTRLSRDPHKPTHTPDIRDVHAAYAPDMPSGLGSGSSERNATSVSSSRTHMHTRTHTNTNGFLSQVITLTSHVSSHTHSRPRHASASHSRASKSGSA